MVADVAITWKFCGAATVTPDGVVTPTQVVAGCVPLVATKLNAVVVPAAKPLNVAEVVPPGVLGDEYRSVVDPLVEAVAGRFRRTAGLFDRRSHFKNDPWAKIDETRQSITSQMERSSQTAEIENRAERQRAKLVPGGMGRSVAKIG